MYGVRFVPGMCILRYANCTNFVSFHQSALRAPGMLSMVRNLSQLFRGIALGRHRLVVRIEGSALSEQRVPLKSLPLCQRVCDENSARRSGRRFSNCFVVRTQAFTRLARG